MFIVVLKVNFNAVVCHTKDMFWAVVRGRKPGIFTKWSEVSSNINGFPGAIVKKFKTRQQAEDFMRPKSPEKIAEPVTLCNYTAIYPEGYCQNGEGGFGLVIVKSDGTIIKIHGRVPISPCTKPKAELYGVYVALNVFDDDILFVTD